MDTFKVSCIKSSHHCYLSVTIYLLFFALTGSSANSQPVVIIGGAPAYRGSLISVYTYKDYITNTPLRLIAQKVNDSGEFRFTLNNIKQTEYLYLNIDNLNGAIYVSPGNTYHVVFPIPDSTRYQNPYISHSIDLVFIIRDTDNINNLIMDFNDEFYNFWKYNYVYFIRKQAAPRLDTFAMQMQKRYAQINNLYFHQFLEYTIADYQLSVLMGTKTLGNRYLKNQPILYHNYEYMKFFNDYFKDYLEQVSAGKEGKDLADYIDKNDYTDLLELLKINPLLRANDSLCELVLLKGLYELYYDGDYKKENIKTILQLLETQTKIDEDRTIAGDMLHSFSGITEGADAPAFTLADAKGDSVSLSGLKGKYIYLGFIKSESEECLGELNVMAALNKIYGKKMYFVCISEDKNLELLRNFLKQNKSFNWKFLYDEGAKVLEQYDVRVLPEFFLLNPAGKFVMAPADEPGHGIELDLEPLFEKK